MHRTKAAVPALACAFVVAFTGCSAASTNSASATAAKPSPVTATASAAQAGATPGTSAAAASPKAADPRTQTASLSIPEIGVKALRVVPYQGTTDDWPGTRIQDRGEAASPYGPHGGVGPGQVGNYLITAHRTSAGGPLQDLPSLKPGELVQVTAGGKVYEYKITETRETSFRSARSLAEQRAAVPGHPGERPTRAMITLSTCATPEDNAAGNFWRDDRGNPEHRIDKVGVLVATHPAQG